MRPSKLTRMPVLSRNGYSSPLGKLTAELPKMRLSEETAEGLRRLAHDEDIPFAEYVRLVLDTHVHGVETMATIAAERVMRVVRKPPTSGAR